MRVAILASGQGWHVRDLLRAADSMGIDAVPRDFRRVCAGVRAATPGDLNADRVLVRTMAPGSLEQVVFRMDVLHRLLCSGVPVLNPPRAVEACVDKYLATALLANAGLEVPPTITCQDADSALEAYQLLGGDVVVKPLFGSEGRGMTRITDVETAWRVFHALARINAALYLQRFIPHEGYDLRAFVMEGRVLAAMRRHSRSDWRTNVAQGGVAEATKLSDAETRLALQAAKAVGATVCGVDLLPGKNGKLYVLEVNAVPGWRALAPATGIDVALELMNFLVRDYAP